MKIFGKRLTGSGSARYSRSGWFGLLHIRENPFAILFNEALIINEIPKIHIFLAKPYSSCWSLGFHTPLFKYLPALYFMLSPREISFAVYYKTNRYEPEIFSPNDSGVRNKNMIISKRGIKFNAR